MLHRLVDEFMRSSQHLHDQVDSLLDSKSIRGGGKSGDSESEFCMAVHGERRGKSEPLSDEVLQFVLGDLGLLDVCQLHLLPKLGASLRGDGPGRSQDHTAQQQLSISAAGGV
jgi:hypothetical protein